MFWPILSGIAFVALGALLFFKPEWVYELTESWKSYTMGDPSDLYLLLTKFGGVLAALAGVLIIIFSLVME